jgi:7,8-dihydroneopterin aldolase/epimerase/oxygenase
MEYRTHGWIHLRGLAIDGAHVGVYPHEHNTPQVVVIDVALLTPTAKAAASDRLSDTIDYDLVARRVREVALERHYALLESLGEALATALLTSFPADRVAVEVHKPGALALGSVSVAIERAR